MYASYGGAMEGQQFSSPQPACGSRAEYYVPTGVDPASIQTDKAGLAGTAGDCFVPQSQQPHLYIGFVFACPSWAKQDSWTLQCYLDDCPLGKECKEPRSCTPSTPNPIAIATGTKNLKHVDGPVHLELLRLNRFYSSTTALTPADALLSNGGTQDTQTFPATGSVGTGWRHQHQASLMFGYGDAAVWARRPDGQVLRFVRSGDSWIGDPDVSDRLVAAWDGGVISGWRFSVAKDNAVEVYSRDGRIRSMYGPDGVIRTYKYADGTDGVASGSGGVLLDASGNPTQVVMRAGLLHSVVDRFGRALAFLYDQQERLARVTVAGATAASYKYDEQSLACANCTLLTGVVYPDGSSIEYRYNEPGYVQQSGAVAALTGVLFNGLRVNSYWYDSQSRASSSELAGGVGRHVLTFGTAGAPTLVLGPAGDTRSYSFQTQYNVAKLATAQQPAGAGCGPASSAKSYDTNGNVSSRDDFNGNRTCMAYDLGRSLETVRVEGLSTAGTCSTVLPQGATLPAGSRKSSTQWHPNWRLATKVSEPGRLTTHVYHGQPDPFNGNAIASCAPGSALLPDGTPIAVLCKKVEQATTDANGSQGFSATLQAGVLSRVWQYTYTDLGQVLTSRDPLNNPTTNTYYADTTADHARGDLQQVQNAAGHLTRHTKYNAQGLVLQTVNANNIATDYTYDARMRLKTETVAGQPSTVFDYWPHGPVKQVTQPDGSWIAYEYDDAQRLTAVKDNLGNRIDYTLNNAGLREAEQVKDPSGALKRQFGRIFDALGRIQQTTGRE